MISTILLSVFVIILFYIINKKFNLFCERDNQSPPHVPGSLPFIGHLPYLGGQPEKVLMKWAKTYGKLFFVNLGPLKTLIIDDPLLMKEILSLPAFNGRIQNDVFDYLTQQGQGVLFSEGKTWESQRKFILQHLREFGFRKQYTEDLVLNEVQDLLATFKEHINKPFLINDTFLLPVLNSLWVLTAGEKLPQQETTLIKLHREFVASSNNLVTTGVMFAPILRRIAPSLLGWNRFVAAVDAFRKFIDQTIQKHQETFVDGHNRDLIDSYISEIRKTTDPDSPFYNETGYKNLHVSVADIFSAGSETTSNIINWAILYLTVNQDIQTKLYEEIIRVIGCSRSPQLSDRPNMPYAEATICETLRISSFVPIGAMHKALYDTEFKGYKISKGTMVIANLYSAHHNPENWSDPENFRPERFLSSSGEKIKNPPAFVPFQVGRRQCLGENFAMDSLFLFVTSIFQQFHICQYNEEAKLNFDPIKGLLRIPKPFEIKLKSR